MLHIDENEIKYTNEKRALVISKGSAAVIVGVQNMEERDVYAKAVDADDWQKIIEHEAKRLGLI